jgi:hypothetical protein
VTDAPCIQAISFSLLGLLLIINGLMSNDIANMVFELSLISAAISITLTTCVMSDSRIKRYIEVIIATFSLGIIIYGYLLSSSLILMISTFIIAGLLTLAFILSYLLPRIR